MDDALTVRPTERVGDLHRCRERLRERERPTGQPVRQRFAAEKFHDQEVDILGGTVIAGESGPADVVQSADVRMTDRGDRTCLALEADPQVG